MLHQKFQMLCASDDMPSQEHVSPFIFSFVIGISSLSDQALIIAPVNVNESLATLRTTKSVHDWGVRVLPDGQNTSFLATVRQTRRGVDILVIDYVAFNKTWIAYVMPKVSTRSFISGSKLLSMNIFIFGRDMGLGWAVNSLGDRVWQSKRVWISAIFPPTCETGYCE